MKRLLAYLVVAAVALAACQGDRSIAPPGGPVAEIFDGANGDGGNPDFFFLPPLVGDPSSSQYFEPGLFNGQLHPVMEVFERTDECGGDDPVAGPTVVPAYPDEQMYRLEWDTDVLSEGVEYRLCVFSSAGGTMLGFVDLAPIVGGKGVKNLQTGEEYTFQQGRVIPVKFRIEYGLLCEEPAMGCTKETIDEDGGQVVLLGGTGEEPPYLAAVDIPDGAIANGDQVTIVIAKEEPQYIDPETGTPQCLPGGLLQSNWCYQIRTEPELYQFQQLVRVEICVDAFPVPERLWDYLRVFKNNETEGLVQLPWADPTLIGSDCSGFPEQLGAARSMFGWLGRLAGRLFAPRELHASMFGTVPKGLGGTGGSFSDFGGAVPLPDLVVSSVDLQTTNVVPGGSITYDYTVSNIGGEDTATTATFDVATYLSSDQVLDSGDLELGWGYSVWTYHLGEGWSQSITMSDVPVPDTVQPGTYYLIVVADAKPGLPPNYYPGVVESDETNNWLAASAVLNVTSIQIDGFLSEGEWDGAAEILMRSDGDYAGATLYVTNDEVYIYYALRVPAISESPDDRFLVRFDNANNGVLDVNEDQICANSAPIGDFDCHSYQSVEHISWSGADQQQNGSAAMTSSGGWKVWEVAHPLASGDMYDFSLTIGDVVGFCAAYFTGNSYVDYPAACIYVGDDLKAYAKREILAP